MHLLLFVPLPGLAHLLRQGLLAQMHRASRGGLIDVLVNSRELYRSPGGYLIV
jgi:hypothetical protein